MQTDPPLDVHAENLRYYLAGFIHIALRDLAEWRFERPLPVIDIDPEDHGVAYFTTRSGTKYKISVETVDVGGALNDQQEADS